MFDAYDYLLVIAFTQIVGRLIKDRDIYYQTSDFLFS